MLLAEHRRQAVLGAGDKQDGRRQQHNGNEQRLITHRGESEEDIEQGAETAEQQHESAVSHPERIPDVADETESESETEDDSDD